jgi:hypothetical protein
MTREELECRLAEAHEGTREQFVTKVTGGFVGKKIVKIDIAGQDLHIELEDGFRLSVQLGSGDFWNAWINVNDISHISLRSLERPDEYERS